MRKDKLRRNAFKDDYEKAMIRIAELEAQLSASKGVEQIIKIMDENKQLHAEIKQLRQWEPTELLALEATIKASENTNLGEMGTNRGLLETDDPNAPFLLAKPLVNGTCAVHFVASVLDVSTKQIYNSSAGLLFYPGTFKDLAADFERVWHIAQRHPLPEDIPLKLPAALTGLTRETLHFATCQLSPFIQSNELNEDFRKALDLIFDQAIEPELNYFSDRSLHPKQKQDQRNDARDMFVLTVKRTFAHMREYGRSGDMPKVKRGRTTTKWRKNPDKNQGIYSQHDE